jgi:threonine/homoserine/homoserine lactone efflux protein
MTLDAAALIPVVLVLMGGAVSPGPSLAVVLRNTIVGGRARGVACSVGHGIGFGIYAFLAISGIALLKSAGMQWAVALELVGAAFLVWIGVSMIRAPERDLNEEDGHPESERDGFIEGFLIAFLNPKIFVFLTAIFSQFIDAGMVMQDRLILAAIALFIDTSWYVIVATTLSGGPLLEKLREKGKLVDITVGVILLGLAAAILLARLF